MHGQNRNCSVGFGNETVYGLSIDYLIDTQRDCVRHSKFPSVVRFIYDVKSTAALG